MTDALQHAVATWRGGKGAHVTPALPGVEPARRWAAVAAALGGDAAAAPKPESGPVPVPDHRQAQEDAQNKAKAAKKKQEEAKAANEEAANAQTDVWPTPLSQDEVSKNLAVYETTPKELNDKAKKYIREQRDDKILHDVVASLMYLLQEQKPISVDSVRKVTEEQRKQVIWYGHLEFLTPAIIKKACQRLDTTDKQASALHSCYECVVKLWINTGIKMCWLPKAPTTLTDGDAEQFMASLLCRPGDNAHMWACVLNWFATLGELGVHVQTIKQLKDFIDSPMKQVVEKLNLGVKGNDGMVDPLYRNFLPAFIRLARIVNPKIKQTPSKPSSDDEGYVASGSDSDS